MQCVHVCCQGVSVCCECPLSKAGAAPADTACLLLAVSRFTVDPFPLTLCFHMKLQFSFCSHVTYYLCVLSKSQTHSCNVRSHSIVNVLAGFLEIRLEESVCLRWVCLAKKVELKVNPALIFSLEAMRCKNEDYRARFPCSRITV